MRRLDLATANGAVPSEKVEVSERPKRVGLYKIATTWWRWITILQIPITLVAASTALFFFFGAKTIVEVKPKLVPGRYRLEEIPDKEFINFAREIGSLVGTYTPFMAQPQFARVKERLDAGFGETFDALAAQGLKAIKENRRSQVFIPDDSRVRVERIQSEPRKEQREVAVYIPGNRKQGNGARADINKPVEMISDAEVTLYVKMVISPRTARNEYGIVANDVRFLEDQPTPYPPMKLNLDENETTPVPAK